MTGNRGFTLVEVLTALAISTAAIMLSMHTVDIISTTQNRGQDYTRAQEIAMTVMEQLMSTFPTDSKLTAGTHTQLFGKDGIAVVTNGAYTARWDVTLDTPITKVIKIQLSVSWQERGSQRTVSYQTFRSS